MRLFEVFTLWLVPVLASIRGISGGLYYSYYNLGRYGNGQISNGLIIGGNKGGPFANTQSTTSRPFVVGLISGGNNGGPFANNGQQIHEGLISGGNNGGPFANNAQQYQGGLISGGNNGGPFRGEDHQQSGFIKVGSAYGHDAGGLTFSEIQDGHPHAPRTAGQELESGLISGGTYGGPFANDGQQLQGGLISGGTNGGPFGNNGQKFRSRLISGGNNGGPFSGGTKN